MAGRIIKVAGVAMEVVDLSVKHHKREYWLERLSAGSPWPKGSEVGKKLGGGYGASWTPYYRGESRCLQIYTD